MSDEVSSESKEPIKVEALTPSSRDINIIVKVASKGETRSITSSRDYSIHSVADVLVGDETGCLYMTLWDDNIGKMNEGDTVSIKNGYVNLFRGSMRLNIGRYGSFEVLKETPIGDVNKENNLSSKQYEQERRFERRDYGGGGSRYGGRGYGRGRRY